MMAFEMLARYTIKEMAAGYGTVYSGRFRVVLQYHTSRALSCPCSKAILVE